MTKDEEIESLKLQLADAKGQALAVERASQEIKRDAKLALEQAEALKAEANNAILTATEQMQIALGVSYGIYGLANLGRAYLVRKVAAARVAHREQTFCGLLQGFLDAHKKRDTTALNAVSERAQVVIQTIKADGDSNRIQAIATVLDWGFKDAEQLVDDLIVKRNPTPV